jgi:XisH protein
MYVDLGAESIVAAERAGQKIAVEIKSFLGASSISEFHTALGQFFNYRLALEERSQIVSFIWQYHWLPMKSFSPYNLFKKLLQELN